MCPDHDQDPSSLLFMAQASSGMRLAMLQMMAERGWDRQLGRTLFSPHNWHQSLSPKWDFSVDRCKRMVSAGARVEAMAFTLVLNRVRGEAREGSSIHWECRATKRPLAFDALLTAPAGLESQRELW